MKTFLALFALSVLVAVTQSKISGYGRTTRYWDCCKPSCSWKENIGPAKGPVTTCAKDGVKRIDASVHSACDNGGTAYICNNLQPWAVNKTLAYGFVAASFTGGVDNSKCCTCFKLTFTNALKGKTMIVQNINTGGDLSANHFDIQMPGGGMGNFQRGCQTQWDKTPAQNWGNQYGGIDREDQCNGLPKQLQAGCHWRWSWYQNANNPDMKFEQVNCPNELTSKSGCSNNN